MNEGRSSHDSTHQSSDKRGNDESSPSSEAKPRRSQDIRDASTAFPSTSHAHRQERGNIKEGTGSHIPVYRSYDVHGTEEGGPSTQPKPAVKESQADKRKYGRPMKQDESKKGIPKSHGPVFQSYHEYGNEKGIVPPRPGHKTRDQRFDTPLISLIPDQQPVKDKGRPGHEGPPYRSYQNRDSDDDKRGMSSHPNPGNAPADNGPSFADGNSWIYFKLALHAIGMIVSLASLIISITLSSHSNYHGVLVAISCPVPAVALVWGIAELVTRIAYEITSKTRPGASSRGIHPAGHLAVCLILWLASVVVEYFLASYIKATDYYCNAPLDEVIFTNYWYDVCKGEWDGSRSYAIAVTALAATIWLVYFFLFVFACVDTARRREKSV